MKTNTRSKILKILEKNGKTKPSDLKNSLKISLQAIHRHLKSLTQAGLIESRGSPPFTQYVLAGIPDFKELSKWLSAKTLSKSPEDFVCSSRDILDGRLPRLKAFINNGLSKEILPLVISTTGEIGNNSFDHNLGQWRDVPGCWMESQISGKFLWICIADRGQGIFKSLNRVHPNIQNDQDALKAAFETIISGRAPEKRGNGLKFVKANLTNTPGGGVACISGSGQVHYGTQGEKCIDLLKRYFNKVNGTITLMVWGLQ
ncbi:MAG: winged helix-turn-helix transcriptional regulator [Bdellovibrio sp.]|nr:winged helix-turn-helix transcriptional regulator [Bdellovibrio sp.]